ncbi:uncharacterized protein LOC124175647 [Neodiprion fabricii]|uniref:uncharacterized protein LOC124175647 n=1 Tax=Neodiprion fabricii TaxID=2872261 RepID=UPI001ED94CAB|nr:uncharacterized protein LOC124175647 [Neodiprion fabricii]
MAPRRYRHDFRSCGRNSHEDKNSPRVVTETCDSTPEIHRRKDRVHRVRSRGKKLNIPKLVYKFLGTVASLEADDVDEEPAARIARKSSAEGNKKSKKEQKRHPNAVRVATKSIDESSTSVTARSEETNSTACTVPSTPASTASGIGTGKKFSIQAIKDYIKAGIAEGKRRAKKYMCKALSFGVDKGYLIPTDSEGQILRVSSALANFNAQKDDSEREMRQKLRRGDAASTSEERKLLRRRAVAAPRKRARSPSSVPSSTSSTKRSRPRTKKPKYARRIKRQKTKGGRKAKRKRRLGRPRSRVNSAKIKEEESSPGVKTRDKDEDEAEVEEASLQDKPSTISMQDRKDTKRKYIEKKKGSDRSIEENSSEGADMKEK